MASTMADSTVVHWPTLVLPVATRSRGYLSTFYDSFSLEFCFFAVNLGLDTLHITEISKSSVSNSCLYICTVLFP